MSYTHQELVQIAAKWSRSRHDVVFTERSNGDGEMPDVMAFSYRWSLMIECKVSMADFYRDKRKNSRRDEKDCIGNFRIYCCPKGLIDERKIPDGWVLLEVYPSGYAKLNCNIWAGANGPRYHPYENTIWWHDLTVEALRSERFMLFRALQDIMQDRVSNKIMPSSDVIELERKKIYKFLLNNQESVTYRRDMGIGLAAPMAKVQKILTGNYS
jgi:hypothetical protein